MFLKNDIVYHFPERHPNKILWLHDNIEINSKQTVKDVGMLIKYTDTREDRGDLRMNWKQACICKYVYSTQLPTFIQYKLN